MISNRLVILHPLVPIKASAAAAALRSCWSGRGSAPSTQNSGGFNLQDYPNLWNQLQHYHEGPAIDNQGNCIADCYGWTGSN